MFLQLNWSQLVVNSVDWTWYGIAHTFLYQVPQSTNQVWIQMNCLQTFETALSSGTDLGNGKQKHLSCFKVPMSVLQQLEMEEVPQFLTRWLHLFSMEREEPSWRTTFAAPLHHSGWDTRMARWKPPLVQAIWWQNACNWPKGERISGLMNERWEPQISCLEEKWHCSSRA